MMGQKEVLHPWEEKELDYFNHVENKAISKERYERLKKLVREDYAGFWGEVAKDIEWFKPWETVLEGGIPGNPEFKFFTGGYGNVCYNMLDRHIKRGAENKLALIWENEVGDRVEFYTYKMLFHEVGRFSNALKSLGVQKSDRIAVFLPNSPAAAIAIMAAYRLGLAFTPLFTGLSVDALRKRLNSFEPKVLVTLDGSFRRGRVLPLKSIIDETLKEVESVHGQLKGDLSTLEDAGSVELLQKGNSGKKGEVPGLEKKLDKTWAGEILMKCCGAQQLKKGKPVG